LAAKLPVTTTLLKVEVPPVVVILGMKISTK
jgi:hypothetical protein